MKHSYPAILGLAAANLLTSLVCVCLTQFILTNSWKWSKWQVVTMQRLDQVVAYAIASASASIIGGLLGSATFYLSDGVSFGYLFFRWFSVVELMLVEVVPLILTSQVLY